MMKEKERNLILEIEKTLNDSEIKNNKEIIDFLTLCKKKLEKNEGYGSVCVKISYHVKLYLKTHHLKAPTALMNLYNYTQKTSNRYTMFGFMSMFL